MIPKSLHTVTALANVARHLAAVHNLGIGLTGLETAVDMAADLLGYGSHVADDYGLKAKAVRVLAKEFE